MTTALRPRPLEALVVVEIGGAAPMFLGRTLVDLGASVWRVQGSGLPTSDDADVESFARVCNHAKHELPDEHADRFLAAADVLVSDRLDDFAATGIWGTWSRKNRRLICVAITPFGADGPFAERRAGHLVTTALSGYLNLTGEEGERPVEPTAPFLAERHAANHALAGLLLALRRRRQTDLGAFVDVAARDASMWMLVNAIQYWHLERVNLSRRGNRYLIGDPTRALPSLFACADGYVVWLVLAGRRARSTAALVALMDEEGMAPRWLRALAWDQFELFDSREIQEFTRPFAEYFLTKTRRQLLDAALERGIMLAPVNAMTDLLDDPQLAARQAWTTRALGADNVRLPRAPVKLHLEWSPATDGPVAATERTLRR